MVGQAKLHSSAACVAAGNLTTDKAVVNVMSTALQSRMIHLNLATNHKQWIEWALTNGIDSTVTSFLEYQPSKLNNFNPNHTDDTFACPRTWEFASKLLKVAANPSVELLAGTLSQGVAREFMAFRELRDGLVPFSEILKNPEHATMPEDKGTLYAAVGSIADHTDTDNAPTVMKYVSRMPAEFQLCTIRRIHRADKKKQIVKVPEVREWLIENAKEWLED